MNQNWLAEIRPVNPPKLELKGKIAPKFKPYYSLFYLHVQVIVSIPCKANSNRNIIDNPKPIDPKTSIYMEKLVNIWYKKQ